MQNTPIVRPFFDDSTNTFTYIVYDPSSLAACIIDSVAQFNPHTGRLSYETADLLIQFVRDHQLHVDWILETHIHADHVSAAPYIKTQLGGKLAIGEGIVSAKIFWQPVFDLQFQELAFDHLWQDQETFLLGEIVCRVMATPGHTAVDVSYLIGDALFVGDTVFMPDYGTARCDFPGGSAHELYRSSRRLFSLPEQTRVFVGHDYLPENRSQYQCETTIKAEKEANIHVNTTMPEHDFVKLRESRDRSLQAPRLIIPALQINLNAGDCMVDTRGHPVIKVPVNNSLFG
ncbi:MBL fold metallo-hydrolase [Candidatus Gracilibacteria bacterium]|nr:MBL fold metallo-hydrolase [Candidatus Gracilibacteria bacterium]